MNLIDLSFLVCPLCGKMTSLNRFDPTELDLEIYVQNVRGLGRGRGFEVVDRRSALGEQSIIEPVKDRLLDLAFMLYEGGLLHREEVAQRFGLSIENNSNRFDELIKEVAEALDEDPEDWDVEEDESDSFATLEFGVERLIEEYLAYRASEEEEDD